MANRPLTPPGPNGWQAARRLRDTASRLDAVVAYRDQFGDLALTRILGKDYYLINAPDLVRQVLVEQADHFRSMPIGKKLTANALRPDVVAADSGFHKQQRKLLQPAFTPATVARYAETMTRYTVELTDTWQPGQPRDIVQDLNHLTLRIVARALFDADVTDQASVFARAVTLGMDYLTGKNRVPFFIPTAQNRQLIGAWIGMDREVRRVIAERRAAMQSGASTRPDLLSALMAATDADREFNLTDKQMHGLVMGLLIAGYETTANALSWTFYLLARSPQVAAALSAELHSALNGRTPTSADLDQLPYTNAIIKESMRLYPPAWAVTRYCVSATELGGYPIKSGATLFMSPYGVQRDPRYYDQPEQFLPERWLGGLDKTLPPYAYFPFGGGTHVCIGQFFAMLEARLVLATIARHYRLSSVSDQAVAPEAMITLRPAGPIMLNVERLTP